MDKAYADTVRLLLAITPDVFANDIFALKGGTAINLFVRDMPRLSVDIDVVYTPWQHTREQAMAAIAAELDAIAGRVAKLSLSTRTIASKDLSDTKLLVENEASQVKVEVNVVFRGTVLPTERRMLTGQTAQMFSAELLRRCWHRAVGSRYLSRRNAGVASAADRINAGVHTWFDARLLVPLMHFAERCREC